MSDDFSVTTARLEELLKQAIQETDREKATKITTEIYRVIAKRDRLRGRFPSVPKVASDSD